MRDGARADGEDMGAESVKQSGSSLAAAESPGQPEQLAPAATDRRILARSPDSPRPLAPTQKPPHQRPELPDFWDHRFTQGSTPWDAAGVPPDLISFVESGGGEALRVAHGRVVIPGCGSAWEAAYLDARGFAVTAIDFSPAAISAAQAQLKASAPQFAGELICADFFSHPFAQPPTLIYERAFLCALPRRLWPGYAPRMAALLPAGGLLAGFFFIADAPKGPPFGAAPGEIEALLATDFDCLEDRPVAKENSIGVFAGKERWQVWRRR
jgi:thiopurine S-methyltransferase